MIYIIITQSSKKEFIKARIDSLQWRVFSGDDFFLVRNELSDARYVLEQLSGTDKLANTVVFKLEDSSSYFYWGFASEEVWKWLSENANNPHTSWTAR